ncbi:MAG TPA: response regulator transcription factor [Vicinamibacterales bacterium]|nr:response regulator transcription factor [Vicinamibacterales bacterium]
MRAPCVDGPRGRGAARSHSPERDEGDIDHIYVVIADDHAAFRQALQMVIDADRGMTVVAAVGDGDAALDAIVRFAPDVAVLDVRMPGRDGIDVARALLEAQLSARPVIMTLDWQRSVFDRAIAAGAAGYLSKESALLDVVDAIRTAARGDTYVAPALSGAFPGR